MSFLWITFIGFVDADNVALALIERDIPLGILFLELPEHMVLLDDFFKTGEQNWIS